MRDYKNVKVPRAYRAKTMRASVKRVQAGRGTVRSGKGAAGIRSAALQFLSFVVLASAAWLGWQAYQTLTHAEMFQVAGVDVKGVKQLGESDLKEIVGAFTGKNIFRADLEAATGRARANAWVREARIHRRLPNRISMVLVERVPAAILDTGTGRYLVDADGTVIEQLSREKAPQWPLPVVSIRDFRARPGEQVTSEGMREALKLMSEIVDRGGWNPAEITIKADSPESLSVVYADQEFRMGSGNFAEKLRRLAEVMDDVKQRNLDVAYVDLRPEHQAAVMVKKNEKVRR